MKPSEVYLEAAKLMEQRGSPEYSCWAINFVATNGKETGGWPSDKAGDYRRQYEKTIIPVNEPRTFSNRKERILALCFMAAIAEDQERAARRRSN